MTDYRWFRSLDTCPYCDAGPLFNDSVHDQNCAINLPGKHKDLMPAWIRGWNLHHEHREKKIDYHLLAGTTPTEVAYRMGALCAEKKLRRAEEETRTLRSLQQALEIERARV